MKPLRAIVTGGATNIGGAISEALLAAGARVVVGQPDPTVGEPLRARYGDRVRVLPVDVGFPERCRSFVGAAVDWLGGLDLLVNNAAITGVGAICDLASVEAEQFDRILRVNLAGPVFCAQAAVPHLRAAGGGVIVNITSINAFRPQRGALLYAATKAALGSVTQSLAKELAPDGIRVVAVAPGDIRVDTSERLEQELASRQVRSDVAGQTPLGRGEPADIGAAVLFLASPGAKFVTGATLLVDGGLLA